MNGRAARRAARQAAVRERFGDEAETVLDLLSIADLAWHDIYDEAAIRDDVVGDVLVLSHSLAELIDSLTLALTDWRDLRLASAAALRDGDGEPEGPWSA